MRRPTRPAWVCSNSPGQDLCSVSGDQNCVFELGGAAPVGGDSGPTVFPHQMTPGPHRNHGLDGEGHVRLHDGVRTRVVVVGDLGAGVENLTDAMAAIRADHAETRPTARQTGCGASWARGP